MDGPPRTHRDSAAGLLGRADGIAAVAGIPRSGPPVPVSAGRPRPADAVLDPGPARPRDRGTAVGGVPAGDHRIRCRPAHAGARIARRRRRPAILRRAPGSDRPRARARAAHEAHLADQRADRPHRPGAGRHPGARRNARGRHGPNRLRVRRRPGGRAQRQQHHVHERDRGGPEPAAHAGRRPSQSRRRPHRPGRSRRIRAGGPGGHGRADRPSGAFRSGLGRDPRRTAQAEFRLRRPRGGVAAGHRPPGGQARDRSADRGTGRRGQRDGRERRGGCGRGFGLGGPGPVHDGRWIAMRASTSGST